MKFIESSKTPINYTDSAKGARAYFRIFLGPSWTISWTIRILYLIWKHRQLSFFNFCSGTFLVCLIEWHVSLWAQLLLYSNTFLTRAMFSKVVRCSWSSRMIAILCVTGFLKCCHLTSNGLISRCLLLWVWFWKKFSVKENN